MEGSTLIIAQVSSFMIFYVKLLTQSVKFLRNEMDVQGTLQQCLGNEIVHRVDLGILIRLVG